MTAPGEDNGHSAFGNPWILSLGVLTLADFFFSYKPQKLISHSSGAYKSKTEVLAGVGFGESPLPGSWKAVFLLQLHMAEEARTLPFDKALIPFKRVLPP